MHVLLHSSTRTFYGFRPLTTEKMNSNNNLLSSNNFEHKNPTYNIVCFKNIKHADHLNNSITHYFNMSKQLPSYGKLCIYPESKISYITKAQQLFDTQNIPLNELIDLTICRNIGLFLILDIIIEDSKISVHGKELIHNSIFTLSTPSAKKILESDFLLKKN